MGRLFDEIKQAIANDRYVIGQHAAERLDERGIAEWQVVAAFASGRLLSERTNTRPNPSIEVEELLADGTEVKVVWSWLSLSRVAKLVTVHFFDE